MMRTKTCESLFQSMLCGDNHAGQWAALMRCVMPPTDVLLLTSSGNLLYVCVCVCVCVCQDTMKPKPEQDTEEE